MVVSWLFYDFSGEARKSDEKFRWIVIAYGRRTEN